MRTFEEVITLYPPPFKNPDGTPAPFEPLQIEDIHKLVSHGRALGYLPVGFGKTGISTYASLMLEPDVTLILVPPILVPQWTAWLRSLKVGTVVAYAGSPRERQLLDIARALWIVSSYGMWKNDFPRFIRELAHRRTLTVVDEAQALKNHRSQLYKMVREFSEGQNLFLMTGTPRSNPGDTYAYIKLNSPECYRTHAQFESIHVAERDFFDQPKKWGNLDILQHNFELKMVFRTKEEVHAALPRANYLPIYYDLDPAHMKLYQKLMTEQLLEIPDGKIDATTAQTLYHQAQQIITNYGYFAGDDKKVSSVFELIDTICDEIGLGQEGASKLILWTQYKRTSGAVQTYMTEKLAKAKQRSVAAYSGANSALSVREFLERADTVNLVAQPASAGAGLNPQHLCWNCAFIETPTRTIPFVQSAGRIDRKGQLYNPNIRILIARGTVQEGLFAQLMVNDDEINKSSSTKTSIRDLIFPK